MTYGAHPTDDYSRSAARATNYTRLTLNFEDAVRAGHGYVELVAAVAIARVEQLELQLRGSNVSDQQLVPGGTIFRDRSRNLERQSDEDRAQGEERDGGPGARESGRVAQPLEVTGTVVPIRKHKEADAQGGLLPSA